jgi:hypothetical protein
MDNGKSSHVIQFLPRDTIIHCVEIHPVFAFINLFLRYANLFQAYFVTECILFISIVSFNKAFIQKMSLH